MLEYLFVAFIAMLAATLFPLSSEALVIGLQLEGYPTFWLWLSATIGNTLGAVINWWLGRYCLHFQDRKWFPIKEPEMKKAQHWFQRYGRWSLLFAWLPIVGDGFTLVAGLMRVPMIQLVLLVGIGKGARYALVLGVTYQLVSFW